jgi:transposase-like protein
MGMTDLKSIIAEAVREGPDTGQYRCQHCGQAYRKETSLAAHQCEPKRRVQQRTEVGVQLGFQAWLRFYEITQGSAKTKTYEDFARNQFYSAFVKFGRHCHSIGAINAGRFIDHVIRNNLKIDHWTHEKHYSAYLLELIKTEAVQDALERGISYMVSWGEEFDEPFNDYFRKVSNGRLLLSISNGRISPWLLYTCDAGMEALARLDAWEVQKIWQFIDSDAWERKLRDYPGDAEMARMLLKEACV